MNLRCPSIVACALASICLIAAHPCRARAADRPNFIVIMADDLGYGDLSCYGGWIKTPNLDALANAGMRFTDFHSSGAVCSPTRAGLMTGRYQQRTGIPGVVMADDDSPVHDDGLQPLEVTFAELLKKAGYATGMFGKWHLGYEPKYNPIHQGFDEFIGYVSGNVDYFSHVDQDGAADWWKQDKLTEEEGYSTHLITKHAIDFIERHKGEPFCLYIPHEAPHYPYQGPDGEAFRKVGVAKVKNNLAGAAARKAYAAMVGEVDTGIGQIMATLKKHDLDKNTLVLFFSDNGASPTGSCGPLRGHKGQIWEGGHRVPMIACWPGRIEVGTTSDALAISIDVMPTLLKLAGVDLPTDRPLDGVDISPIMFGEAPPASRTIFFQHANAQAMRDGPWKLVRNEKDATKAMLYNLSDDLAEKTDLAASQPDRLAKMNAALDKWKADVETGATRQPSNR